MTRYASFIEIKAFWSMAREVFMKKTVINQIDNILVMVGLLAILPGLYFVSANILKYELNILPNINIIPLSPIVLIGGLLLAIILNFYSILHQRRSGTHTAYEIVKTRLWNVIVFVMGALFLTLLLGYAVVENL